MIQRSPLPEPRAQAALTSSPIQVLRQLTVAKVDDRLCIRGSVTSFYHKQLAQELVLSVAGGMEVVNDIDVVVANSSVRAHGASATPRNTAPHNI